MKRLAASVRESINKMTLGRCMKNITSSNKNDIDTIWKKITRIVFRNLCKCESVRENQYRFNIDTCIRAAIFR